MGKGNPIAEKVIDNFIFILNEFKQTDMIDTFINELKNIDINDNMYVKIDLLIEKMVYSFFYKSFINIEDNEILKIQTDLVDAYHGQIYFNEIFLEKMISYYFNNHDIDLKIAGNNNIFIDLLNVIKVYNFDESSKSNSVLMR